MLSRTYLRRAAAALATLAFATGVLARPAAAALDTDDVKLTAAKVDFGNGSFNLVLDKPTGAGQVEWNVVTGFYTPRVTGYLWLNNAKGTYARMHVSYWDGGGNYIDTRHGGVVHATDNNVRAWSVDLSPLTQYQIVEVHVCTETGTDGVNFTIVDCQTEILN